MGGLGGRSYATRCHVCRKRKVKCDGKKPSCLRCEKAGIPCTGYERSLEFAFFDGQSVNKVERAATTARPSKVETSQDIKDRRTSTTAVVARISMPVALSTGRGNSVHQALSVPQYKAGFLAMLHDRYLPQLPSAPISMTEGLCATWITTACDIATMRKSGMISDSLLAISLAVLGVERNDPAISNTALRHYTKVLNRLQVGLGPDALILGQQDVDFGLITCLACASYEMVARQSVGAFSQHLNGVSAIFIARGVENLRSNISRTIYYDFRIKGLLTSLINRRTSFMSWPEWMNPSWRATEPQSTYLIQTLIDKAIHLPTLQETWDKARLASKLDAFGMKVDLFKSFIHSALKIEKDIEQWEIDLRCNDDTSQLYIARLANDTHGSPGVESYGKTYTVEYSFPNLAVAAALIYYEMTQIFLQGLLLELILYAKSTPHIHYRDLGFPSSKLDVHAIATKSIECADRICQSLKYFFGKDKKIIGRMAIFVPFKIAHQLFLRLSHGGNDYGVHDASLVRKIDFCNEIARLIEEEGLLLWSGPGNAG